MRMSKFLCLNGGICQLWDVSVIIIYITMTFMCVCAQWDTVGEFEIGT